MYKLWSCLKVCEALNFLLDNSYSRFGSKLYSKYSCIGIPMDTNCASLVADLFLFSYERDLRCLFLRIKDSEIIEAFSSTSRYFE